MKNKRASYVTLRDRLFQRCTMIATVSELLACCDVDELNPKTVARAGLFIEEEIRRLEEELESLCAKLPKSGTAD